MNHSIITYKKKRQNQREMLLWKTQRDKMLLDLKMEEGNISTDAEKASKQIFPQKP